MNCPGCVVQEKYSKEWCDSFLSWVCCSANLKPCCREAKIVISFHYSWLCTCSKLGEFVSSFPWRVKSVIIEKTSFLKGTHWESWQNDKVTYFFAFLLFLCDLKPVSEGCTRSIFLVCLILRRLLRYQETPAYKSKMGGKKKASEKSFLRLWEWEQNALNYRRKGRTLWCFVIVL